MKFELCYILYCD